MSDETSSSGSLELSRYWSIVRSRWLLILGFVAIGTLLAAAYVVVTPKTYTATTLVNLNVIADQPFSTQRSASGLIDPATESQLARSSAVLEDAAGDLGDGATIADVRRSMTVTVLPEATVAKITYDAPSLDRAIAGADAVGTAFVDYRTVAAQAQVDRIVEKLEDQQTALSRDLTAVNKALGEATTPSQRAAAVSQREVIEAQLNALLTQLSDIASVDTSGGYVITEAGDNAVAVQPHARLLIQIGFGLGLVLGVIAAFVANAFDQRIDSATDVAKARGGVVLARLTDRDREIPSPVGDADAYGSVAERLLALAGTGRDAFTIVDLSGETQPSVAANLVLSLASTGDTTVTTVFPHGAESTAAHMVEGCGGRPTQSPLPTLGGTAVRWSPDPSTRPSDEVSTGRDLVVVALPADAPRSAILAAARRTGTVVAVVERRRTSARAVRAVVDDLATVGATLVGTVMAPRQPRLRSGRRARRARAEKGAAIPAPDSA